MGRTLGRTAESFSCSERTLRRYINDGLLRGRRFDRHRFELPEREERYAGEHWSLLHGLRAALRTERDVRLAVLFGSTATGEDTEESDVDLLVVHRREATQPLGGLRRRLSDALGRNVHVIRLDDARCSPNLLADVLIEGRVIVDRDALWSDLQDQRESILGDARRGDAKTLWLAHAAVAAAQERLDR